MEDTTPECVVCLKQFQLNDCICYFIHCDHVCHQTCIVNYQNTCPICDHNTQQLTPSTLTPTTTHPNGCDCQCLYCYREDNE